MSTTPSHSGGTSHVTIRVRLDFQDIFNLSQRKVLYRDTSGRPLGTGDSINMTGKYPVQIVLTNSDADDLRQIRRGPRDRRTLAELAAIMDECPWLTDGKIDDSSVGAD